jgi:NitT/TauT family transport system permease protein
MTTDRFMVSNEPMLGDIGPPEEFADAHTFAREQRMKRFKRAVFVWIGRIVLLAGALYGWHALVSTGVADPFFVGDPQKVGDALWSSLSTPEFWHDLRVTCEETLVGFAIGAALGLLIGFALALWPYVDAVVSPYLLTLNATPRVAFAPLFILWFGIGSESKIWFSVSVVVFIVLAGTEAGIKSADSELMRMAEAHGAGWRARFIKVVLPGAVPSIFASFRLGTTYSLLAVVFGEMTAAEAGLGQKISLYSGQYKIDHVLAVVIVLALLGTVLGIASSSVERRLLRWQ